MTCYKGIIFDFNGVLLWDKHLHEQAFNEMSQEIRKKPFTKAELDHHMHGRTNKQIFAYLLGYELAPKELDKWATKKELMYQALAKKSGESYVLSPGAEQLLDFIVKRNIPHTIATSSPTMNMPFFNSMLHLDNWFDMQKIVCDDGTLSGKPAPDIYLKAAKIIGLHPKDCVVFEDAKSGIESALSAGIGKIIGIGPQNTHSEMSAMGLIEVVESLEQVNLNSLLDS